jgi:DNA-binding NarL/FixJ family response regulator
VVRRKPLATGGTSFNVNEFGQSTEQGTSRIDEKISLVVSDFSHMNSELLARALSRVKNLTILKCSVNFIDTLEAIVDLHPDVAVISIHLSDGPYRGLEIIRRGRQISTKTRYIVLIDDSDHDAVVDAFRAGARGLFRRSASTHLLARCISAVYNGQIWAGSADLQQVVAALERAMPLRCVNAQGESLLTKREQELVPLVAHGLTNKEISGRLGLSEHTIKNHLFRIYEKLGISSRVELILYAVAEREERF